MTTNHTKDEARLTCHQVHPECDVYHPDGHPIKDETLTPDAKTVADKLTSIMFVEGYVGKENLEAVNFLLTQTLTQDRAATLTLLRERVDGLRTREMQPGESQGKYLAFKRGENHMRGKVLKVIDEVLVKE